MRSFFSLSTSLMNRLSYTGKFALLGLISLLAIAVVVYGLFANLNQTIRTTQQELDGIALITPTSRAIQLVQRHRALSAAVIGDAAERKNLLTSTESEIVDAYSTIENKLPSHLLLSKNWRHIKESWGYLLQTGLSMKMGANFTAHTQVIDQLLSFEADIADEYKLTLDSEISTYYLIDTIISKLPRVLEDLGQIRGLCTGILASKKLSPQEFDLHIVIAKLDDSIASLKANLKKTAVNNPEVQAELMAASNSISDSWQRIYDIIKSDIYTRRFAMSSEEFFLLATEEIDSGYLNMSKILLPTSEMLLKSRQAQAEKSLYTSMFIASLLFLVVIYFAIGIYKSITDSIKSLANSARSFANGNTQQRVNLIAHDELSQIGDSFNEMAEGFNTLLKTHLQDETRLRATIETAMDGVVQMDAEGLIINWSCQAEKIFGWTAQEVIGKTLHETVIPEQYREAHIQGLKHFLRCGEGPALNSLIEIFGLHRDGHEFPIELTIAAINMDGNYEFSAFTRDITERKQAEMALLQHKIAIETTHDGFWIMDAKETLLEVNKAYAEMSAYSIDELKGMHISQLEANELSEDEVTARMEHIMAQGWDVFEIRHRRKDGREIELEESVTYIKESRQFVTFFRDISDRKITEQAMRVSAIAFETHESIMITDANANIIRVNHAFQHVTGYSAEDVLGKNPRILSSGRQDNEFYALMWQELLNKGSWTGEIWDKRKNGQIYPKWLTITAVKDKQGNITEYVAIFSDITARKKAEEEIYSLAFYDMLTKLPNRRFLIDRIQQAQKLSANSKKFGALLFLDMDRFKNLNDMLGHDHGDLFLIEVAKRMQYCVRDVDTVARIGGDEFVVLIEEIGLAAEDVSPQIAILAEKIRSALAEPYQLNENEHHSSPSIGACLYRANEESVDSLLKHADMAMYQAKESGRNAVRFYDPAMQLAVETRAALEADMRHAVTEKQLCLYYQIQLDSELRPLGAEALIRWFHPVRGMVSPAQFIPIAEDSSLILDIGQWVIETACKQLAKWGERPQTRHLILAINVSAQQFKKHDFVDMVSTLIHIHQVNPKLLKLELTESVVLNNVADVIKKMHALKALGIRLSLDDFGTGYSSLSYLKQLPLDQIKIDQSFVRDITTDLSDAVMVQTIISLAKSFRLNVIAEGVETDAQLHFLKENGCMAYQGYLFSKPVPIEDFDALLSKS